MKKVLLATSILAASAGFAAAEVAVSGSARMGLVNNGQWYDSDGDLIGFSGETEFSSRVRITFTASGETDGGLSFGASVRNDQSGQGGGYPNRANSDSTVYVSGAFGKLTFGDNDTAANTLVGQVSAVGFTGLGSYNEVGYVGQIDTSMLYEYSSGALSFALSAGQLSTGFDEYSLAVKYATDAFSVALGYEHDVFDTAISLGGTATFGAVTGKLVVIDYDNYDTDFALSVDYVAGPTTVTAFYHDAPEAFGLGAAYDLGGGATVKGGIVNLGVYDETLADVGITMSF